MAAVKEKVTKKDQAMARSFVRELGGKGGKSLSAKRGRVRMRIGSKECDIPDQAAQLLVRIMKDIALGKSVSLVSSPKTIGTEQAAQILNVSRPHVVKLLESGAIPFTKAGTHRRIALQDVQDYLNANRANRSKKLDLLAKQAQELNLGY